MIHLTPPCKAGLWRLASLNNAINVFYPFNDINATTSFDIINDVDAFDIINGVNAFDVMNDINAFGDINAINAIHALDAINTYITDVTTHAALAKGPNESRPGRAQDRTD